MSKIQETFNGKGRKLFESEKPLVDVFNVKYSANERGLLQADQEWTAYAKRSGLLDANGIASAPEQAHTAYSAYCAAWNRCMGISQPVTDKREPVAWKIMTQKGFDRGVYTRKEDVDVAKIDGDIAIPLYSAPPIVAQPVADERPSTFEGFPATETQIKRLVLADHPFYHSIITNPNQSWWHALVRGYRISEKTLSATQPVTCQIYGHIVGHCAECNVGEEAPQPSDKDTAAKAKIDWSKPVQTKDGYPFEVVSTQGEGEYPVTGYINGRKILVQATHDGRTNTLTCDDNLSNAPQPSVPDVSAMVNRFLGWKLPQDFHPDCGISFDGRKDDEWNKNKTWPTGTNLFNAEQAKAMFEYVLAAAPSPKEQP